MPGLNRVKHSGIPLLAVMLVLTLIPLLSCADTSAVIYSPYAPEISRRPVRTPVTATNTTNDPQVSGTYGFSNPWLTDLELAKIRDFQSALRDGEIGYTGQSIINPDSVTDKDVAVFILDPNDFCGESFYVFLPDSLSMTDMQLVALAAAFEELKIDFDPDSLNDRNCCRHSNVLETRTLTAEESKRMEAIKNQIRRGRLNKKNVTTDTQILAVEKRVGKSWGIDRKIFLFYPYRRLTDDELTLFALEDETEWNSDPETLKTTALKTAESLILLPKDIREYEPSITREFLQLTSGGTYKVRSGAVYKYTSSYCFDGYDGFYDSIHCNMDIIQMQESGSTPETAGIHLWYGYYPAFSDADYPESHEAEWLAAAQNWAEKTLRLPSDVLQNGWIVKLKQKNYGSDMVQLRLVTEEWEICVWLYRNTAKVCECLIYNPQWYDDDTQKGFFI